MRLKVFVSCLTVSGLIASTQLMAQSGDGLALMKVEAGARPSGMGGAFVAVGGDPVSAAYNPAGVTENDLFTVSFGHVEYWENIRFETGYVTAKLSDRFFYQGGIRYAQVDNIEGRFISTLDPLQITEFDA
ncbi:MAG: hypothetical protein ACOYVF_02425 [Candidatus Zixiibacteriota bacterium]